MKLSALAFFCIIFLSSCIARTEKHGFMFEFSDHEILQEGVTSRESVFRNLGSPTIVSDLDYEEVWIYFAEDLKNFLFFKPKIVKREILVIQFESDTIKKLKKISLSNEIEKLQFLSKYTQVESHEVGFFKSIFSNVGQVKPQ